MDSRFNYRLIGLSAGCLAVALMVSLPGSAHGDVTFGGYLDIVVDSVDTEGMDKAESGGVATYELRAMTDLGEGLTGSAHIAGDGENDIWLEQANVSYQINDNLSLIAGKYLSALGWEAFHAPDLYQISTSATLVYPGMMNGAGLTHSDDGWSLYGAVLAGVWNSDDTNLDEIGYEAQLKLMPAEGMTVQIGYAREGMAATTNAASFDQALLNVWVSYQLGSVLLAGEFNDVTDWGAQGTDGDGYLVMANIPLGEKLSVTLRYSALDVGSTDVAKYTISPSYTVTENWIVRAEFNSTDAETDSDTDVVALESILTF